MLDNIFATDSQLGTVIRAAGVRCQVKDETGALHTCIVRGKFRVKGLTLKTTNPVAVGDRVRFEPAGENSEVGLIVDLLPRKNFILRRAAVHAHKVHILCANIDQAVFIFTLSRPRTSPGFADRFLVTAEAYDIPAVIIFNKIDQLKTEDEQRQLESMVETYRKIGYPVHRVNALDPAYREEVQDILRGRVSFLGGHSGAGKSTLANLIDPDLDLRTGKISDSSTKGQHTTTYAQMFPLAGGGALIDSPGIKELGLVTVERAELAHFFPEMLALLPECRFHNCLHLNEPGCAVKTAVETGDVAQSRYQSYLGMLDE